jgi:hypothetical protein
MPAGGWTARSMAVLIASYLLTYDTDVSIVQQRIFVRNSLPAVYQDQSLRKKRLSLTIPASTPPRALPQGPSILVFATTIIICGAHLSQLVVTCKSKDRKRDVVTTTPRHSQCFWLDSDIKMPAVLDRNLRKNSNVVSASTPSQAQPGCRPL